MKDAIEFSHEWFENALVSAIRDAIMLHGDPARMVGWTIREGFVQQLPRGSFTYHGEQEFQLKSAAGDGA